MKLNAGQKETIKRKAADCFRKETEVRKVVLFGSFENKTDPHDMDLAVFQDSGEDYLSLAMKYRRLVRPVAARIPVDVIPVKADADDGAFLTEIGKGEVIYEK
ncbi:MAG: nucleotidyltransferase domain-containing protein [Kiritimatiellia bacterium]|nr:nucleotidyltransferase domain-containing protein [Kiritimatiellia bacterium]